MLSARNLSLGFGGPPLLDGASFEIRSGDRVGLIGRNGAGKSSLLRILTKQMPPDAGEVVYNAGSRVAFLPQEIPDDIPGTIGELLASGLKQDATPHAEWEVATAVERLSAQMELDPTLPYATQSAGLKRRALLGQCVIREPDLLLLDEPTNHLDLESIAWMEQYLAGFPGALLFITHDRTFLRRLATRFLDLDRGQVISWDCDYERYLTRKEEWLEAEERQQAVFDKKLAQEEAWIRQGIKARRTRNEGRVRALKKMREERRARRDKSGTATLNYETAQRSGVKVIEADNLTYAWGDRVILRDFTTLIERGEKIGLVGPNGAGKSTLLQLLLGKLTPANGTVQHGTNLQIAFFDQMRAGLDDSQTLQEAIAEGQEYIELNGERMHVISYLKHFLFPSDRARSTVGMLSGGERNRLLLARLFARPFNLLVMDEPTNDLDLETLELLEELLADYPGTLLLVSHDRAFLDNVVTELLVLDGSGDVETFYGGYSEYVNRKREREAAATAAAKAAQKSASKSGKTGQPRRFLNRERWELEALPGEIEKLEAETAKLTEELASPAVYQENPDRIPEIEARLAEIEEETLAKMERWEELEKLKTELEG
jgi:ATP-binding cassette subfamily F protein uup